MYSHAIWFHNVSNARYEPLGNAFRQDHIYVFEHRVNHLLRHENGLDAEDDAALGRKKFDGLNEELAEHFRAVRASVPDLIFVDAQSLGEF